MHDYTKAHKLFFETPFRVKPKLDFITHINELFPRGWKISRRDFWYDVHPDSLDFDKDVPHQGFKIHISSTIDEPMKVLQAISPTLRKHSVPFKMVANQALWSYLNGKNSSRKASGKLVTIYPKGHEEFIHLSRELVAVTSKMEGPYILSDKRVPGSSVVFYRYGAIRPIESVNDDGTKKMSIVSPKGALVEDMRAPYFRLPDWVDDPFPDDNVDGHASSLLNNRYRVMEALKLSNSGGVYLADDKKLGKKVIIKEARRHTNAWQGDLGKCDAVDILKHEHCMLESLQSCAGVIGAIDYFHAWEHDFLVVELAEGIPLSNFRASSIMSLAPFRGDAKHARRFTDAFVSISKQLIRIVRDVHAHGVVINDLSCGNVVINKSFSLSLIDFEAASKVGEKSAIDYFSKHWKTPGMRRPGYHQIIDDPYAGDWYAVAMMLQSMILPINTLFSLKPNAQSEFLRVLVRDADLPDLVPNVIEFLVNGVPDSALALIKNYRGFKPQSYRRRVNLMRGYKTAARRANVLVTERRCKESIEGILISLEQRAEPDRPDRLWPLDCSIFKTNGVGFGFGAAGPIAFASKMDRLNDEVRDKFSSICIANIDNIPIGLSSGLAGICYALDLYDMGESVNRCFDAMMMAAKHSNDPSYSNGIAGCLWVALYLYRQHGDGRFERAIEILVNRLHSIRKVLDGEGRSWSSPSMPELQGVAYGGLGISLVATQLVKCFPKVDSYQRLAVSAFMEDFGPAAESLQWRHTSGDNVVSPYWLTGASGVVAVAARLATCTGDQVFIDICDRIIHKSFTHYCVLPGQIEGLAGIGEALLDVFSATDNEKYRMAAFDVAQSVLLYEICDGRERWYPGRALARRSVDFNYGGVGIGFFFDRLLSSGERILHDI